MSIRSRALIQWLAVAACGAPVAALAQSQPPACKSAEYRQLDFWVGQWHARWLDAAGKAQEGTNRIELTLDGCVVVEHFDGRPGTPLQGTSVSTYDAAAKRWKQTWVDNTGGYIDLVGGFEGERMILSRTTMRDGKPVLSRMVFEDITPKAFTWLWQSSADDGKTWRTLWRIDYRRK
jgi:Protein of unknown function (DUF1579)